MQEKLASPKTAMLAQKKGFNWPAHNFYQIEDDNMIYAPTLSLLQMWLIVEHNIYVWAEPESYHDQPIHGFHYDIMVYDKNDVWDGVMRYTGLTDAEPLETYEEAFDAGLYDALRMIEK